MVRSVAERRLSRPGTYSRNLGHDDLTGKTIWSALRPPYPYGGESVSQFLFALRLALVSAARS